MSHTPESELNSRWRLQITAGYEDEYDLIIDDEEDLAYEIRRLCDDPTINSIRCDRYYGRRKAGSSQYVPVMACQL
jgi:hypothetical protein